MSREWTFRSEVARPDGVVVSVAVSVPEGQTGERFLDISELGQMTAARLAGQLDSPQYRDQLFGTEVPF